MKLKRYCVTVMDNWTPTREFWTLEGATWFYKHHRNCANVFKWDGEVWNWMFGAQDRDPPVIKSPHQGHLRVFRDLAIAADTAELMMRPYYPAEAMSLRAKVKAAKDILDVSICKTCVRRFRSLKGDDDA